MNKHSKSVQFASECPRCLSAYQDDDLKLIKNYGHDKVFHISCMICRSSMIVSLLKQSNGILCTGVVTDLSYTDAKRFSNEEPISADDIINLHEQLKLDKIIKIM